MGDWKIEVSGSNKDFEDDFGFIVQQAPGAGMPPMKNISTPYGLLDGALYQRTIADVRTFTLTGIETTESACTAAVTAFHTNREAMIDFIRPNRGVEASPVKIQYTGGASTIEIEAYYDAGLEMGMVSHSQEQLALRFVAFDPFWKTTTTASDSLTVWEELANTNGIAQQKATGEWINMDGGSGSTTVSVYDLVYDSTGKLYAGGLFEDMGTVAANNVAYWDGSNWNAMDGGVSGNGIWTMATRADDNVFIGGDFTAAGSDGWTRISRWDGNAWNDVDGGMDDSVRSILVSSKGDLWVGGDFDQSGSITTCLVARMLKDGDEWIKTGSFDGTSVRSLVEGLDGTIYAAGIFDTVNGASPLSCCNVAKWDDSASQWNMVLRPGGTAVQAGLSNSGGGAVVQDLAVGIDGTLYAVGTFNGLDTVEGVAGAVTACGIAQWNGTSWTPVGTGSMIGGLNAVEVNSENGWVVVGGKTVTSIDGVNMLTNVGLWTGANWYQLPTKFPGDPRVRAVAASGGAVTYGFDTKGSASLSTNTVSNAGTSNAYPIFTASGPGKVYGLFNYTSEQAIFFSDFVLQTGEVFTMDLSPSAKTLATTNPNVKNVGGGGGALSGTISGTLLSLIRPGSDFTTFSLLPGDNIIGYTIEDNAASAELTWTPRYWTIDT